MDAKYYAKPLLAEYEGYSSTPYDDQKGNPTVGFGFNMNDEDNLTLLQEQGINPEDLKQNRVQLDPEVAATIKEKIMDKKIERIKARTSPELYDTLPANKQGALLSMGYGNLNLIGPQMREYLAKEDDLGAIQEIMLRSNKVKDPGIQRRRLREAQVFAGDDKKYEDAFKAMSEEDRNSLYSILEQIENENTRKEALETYGKYLRPNQTKPKFTKLFNK